ncbi:hypothetical protein METHB2_300008 [Candidatus Methylobacter favarea]|uniref:Uncharacterized protein n=1 Tax=Candidatus Methylobacter favarea TaxID=2707345 RepID=A0A8S0X8B1_9GAMM|nr:hypothetical protein METHB2_300008 [Candidatus Methylobacter favarea]
MRQFIVYRRHIAVGRMKSLAVAEHFELFEHGLFSLRSGLIGLISYQFGFQATEEAF